MIFERSPFGQGDSRHLAGNRLVRDNRVIQNFQFRAFAIEEADHLALHFGGGGVEDCVKIRAGGGVGGVEGGQAQGKV